MVIYSCQSLGLLGYLPTSNDEHFDSDNMRRKKFDNQKEKKNGEREKLQIGNPNQKPRSLKQINQLID